MRQIMLGTVLFLGALVSFLPSAMAETIAWRGPSHTITIGLSEIDIAHVEFPEEIINVTVEDPEFVDILVVEGYGNRAFRMRALAPRMATRLFLTGRSQKTYIVVVSTDVPYNAYVQITDGTGLESQKAAIARKFNDIDMLRAMATESELPGVMRETYVIPNWFEGAGLNFELTEIWQSPKFTGLVAHVSNETNAANEVNLPAISLPRTDEWGVLRRASMENLRLAPKGKPGDKGVAYLLFQR